MLTAILRNVSFELEAYELITPVPRLFKIISFCTVSVSAACCGMLAVLCWCCITLYRTAQYSPYCAIPTAPCYNILHHTITALNRTEPLLHLPYCTILHHSVLHHISPYRTAPYCATPYCTIPSQTMPHHTISYHTVS